MKRAVLVGFVGACALACARPAADPETPAATPCPPPAPDSAGYVQGTEGQNSGLPEVPAALRARVEPYLSMRGAGFESLSDDGTRMLITTRFADTYQIHLILRPGGARTQLTFSKEPVRDARFIPGAPEELSFLFDQGGNELYQIYRSPLGHESPMRLTDGTSRNQAQLWSDDGKALAFSSTRRNGKDFDVYVTTADGAAPTLVFQGSGMFFPVDWSADGTRLLVMKYISAMETELHLVDLVAKSSRQLTPPSPPAAYAAAQFGARSDQIYVVSNRASEFHQLFSVELAKDTWKPLGADIAWDVEALAVSADGKNVAFAVNERGESALYSMRDGGRAARVPGLPRGIVTDLAFAARAPVLGFTLSLATSPSDAYTYSLATRKLERWTTSEVGGVDREKLVEPSLIEYPTFDGRNIPAILYQPKGGGPHPVLVDFHGGPEGQARPYFHALTQFLVAELGVAVVKPNVRGSSGYGKTYLGLDDGMLRHDAVRDGGALLDWIATQPHLDARRIAVFGGSYGGFMALASLVGYPERIAAGIDLVGISNFVSFLENTSEYRRDQRRSEYGDERHPEMRRYLESVSPLTHVDRIRAPLFVAQGANDPRVPQSEAEQIVSAVRGRGHEVWYLLAADEGHGFHKRANSDRFFFHTVQFLTKHLGLASGVAATEQPPAQ